MKIAFTGVELPEGKVKYQDKALQALIDKDKPKKVTPYFAELMRDEFVQAETIVVPRSNVLDLLILDMEKIESRMERCDSAEKTILEKCMQNLEEETPLCDVAFNESEAAVIKMLAPHSFKPVVLIDGGEDVNNIITMALEKAGNMFFYTSGPSESHAWLVKKGSTIVECAEKIHSDLARGFIKGDIVTFEDYLTCHNFNECKSKGIARVVDRGYIVQPGEVIEIRFNV
ncbi:MAG: DUF933 domain-containing protein [Candidatus Margulisiibacteriota bacterium]